MIEHKRGPKNNSSPSQTSEDRASPLHIGVLGKFYFY